MHFLRFYARHLNHTQKYWCVYGVDMGKHGQPLDLCGIFTSSGGGDDGDGSDGGGDVGGASTTGAIKDIDTTMTTTTDTAADTSTATAAAPSSPPASCVLHVGKDCDGEWYRGRSGEATKCFMAGWTDGV
jgi:hypothetical protein